MEAGHSTPQPAIEPEPVSRQVPCMWFSNVPVNMEVEGGPEDKKVSLQAICYQWSTTPDVSMLRNPATGNPYGHAILAVSALLNLGGARQSRPCYRFQPDAPATLG